MNKRRPPRRKTKPDVIRTHLAVITSPSSGGGQVNLHGDVALAKAAALYADSIEILSLGQQAVQSLADFSGGPDENILALMTSLDDKTLQHLAGGSDPAQLRQAVALIGQLDPAQLQALSRTSPELAGLEGFADVLRQSRDQMTTSMQGMRDVVERMRAESGASELDVAFRSGLVRYNTRVPVSGDNDAVIAAFTREVKLYLQDPLKFVLLDSLTASLVRSMISEGLVDVPKRSIANAGEALLGTGFLNKLPTLPLATMAQVLEVREELEDPLTKYRRKVTDLRSHLLTGPFDAHADAEVHGIWRSEVDPAVSEIRQAMADHTLSKELLREAGQDLAQFVGGTFTRGGVIVLAANTWDVNAVLTTGLAAASASIPIVARALSSRKKARDTAKGNDLYYLYAVDQKLQN